MGKAKTQRTEALHNAARRYVLAKQAQQAIAQHNLDKLVRSGVIVTEPTGNPEIYDYDPEYTRPTSHRGHYGDCAEYRRTNSEGGGQGKPGGGRL